MKRRGILSVIMTVLVIVSMLPSMAFAAAAPSGTLDGKLKIKGLAAVGVKLAADYEKVTPEGMTDDYVTFQWSRKNGDQVTELSTEKTYQVTEEDLGASIVLKITGAEELGVSGSLSVESNAVAATEDEAKALLEQKPAEEAPAEEAPAETVPEDTVQEEVPAEDGQQTEELPTEDTSIEEMPADEDTPEDTMVDVEDVPFEDPSADELVPEEPADENTPEDTAPEESLTYTASAAVEDGSGMLDFGTVTAGASDAVEAQYATITNTGTGDLNFNSISPEHFMVADIGTLSPGESASVWVQPREGISAGSYSDTIEYTTAEGASASFQASVTVAEPETEEPPAEEPGGNTSDENTSDGNTSDGNTSDGEVPGEGTPDDGDTQVPDYGISVKDNVQELAFGELTEGADVSGLGQTVTISNVGTEAVTLSAPVSQYFDVAASGETAALNPLGEASYQITPKAGLGEGEYSEELVFGISENADVKVVVTASVQIKKAEPPAEPEISISMDQSEVSFDSREAGYTELPEAKTVVITNAGEGSVVLAEPAGQYFTAKLSQTELAAGEQATLIIQPTTGLNVGNYSEALEIYEAGEGGALLGTVAAEFTVTEKTPEPDYSYSVSPEGLDFGSLEQGYGAPEVQTVTVSNTGNQTLKLTDIRTDTKAYKMGGLSSKTAEPGENITFKVRPAEGLEAGTYSDKITIVSEAGVTKEISLSFAVTKSVVKVTAVHRAPEITGLTNGIKKTADSLGLPATVVIETTNGNMNAGVTWNVDGCAYKPESVEAQTFEVSGTVTLPEGVENPDNVKLSTAVKVSVKAYVPKVPDASATTVTGISSDGDYTTDSKITITAVGGGMDNASPRKGDIRYVPASWKVLESRNWDGAPYTATFRMNKSGDYTLTVAFNEQKYDGSQWVKTNQQATRQVNFKVKQGSVVTATPTPTAQQRKAVKTGDNTMILPMVIILIAAVVCIAGILVYRRRKK